MSENKLFYLLLFTLVFNQFVYASFEQKVKSSHKIYPRTHSDETVDEQTYHRHIKDDTIEALPK